MGNVKGKIAHKVMPQLRVGHWVYRIEGQYLGNPLFLRQNGVSLPAAQLSAKMVKCENFLKIITDSYDTGHISRKSRATISLGG
jgi:hypothetical protein